jgi:hypothetical protein
VQVAFDLAPLHNWSLQCTDKVKDEPCIRNAYMNDPQRQSPPGAKDGSNVASQETWYSAARKRARRRKSPWNLLLPLFSIPAIGLLWYGLFSLIWAFHVTLYPEHEFRDFWRHAIPFRVFIPSFLMMFAVTPAAVAAGLMTGNLLVWLIPPARRVLNAESEGHPGASFSEATKTLAKFTMWALGIGLIIACIAAACLPSLH